MIPDGPASLALKSNGAVAWIGAVSSVIGGRSAVEVHKADSNRPAVLLDTGAGIVPNSLGLHGSRLFWRHGAAARTATLS